MNFGEFLEKEFVVGHGVENARSCKDHAIGGAESGNQNGERHDLTRPGAEDGRDRRCSDSLTHGHFRWAKSKQVSDHGNEVKPDENQGAHQKSTRESFLRIDDFAGAVSAELPAFIRPKNRDHRQTEIGPEAQSWVDDAERGRNVAGMVAKSKQQGTEDDDDAHLDEGGPILKI